MTTYGLTPDGFVPKPQQTIISEIETALQGAFGQNLNFAARAVFGQLVGIFSEREALLWQLGEALYASRYPAGAEGTSVDNLLSQNNMRRLPAAATKTAPTDTAGVPGLVLYGTAGTIIPAGSLITVDGSPTTQFATDADVTIGPAVNAIQQLSFAGGIPSSGSFQLRIVDPAGNALTTGSLAWNASTAAIQTAIRALNDTFAGNFPYTDVVVTGSIGAGLLVFTFGGAAPTVGQPPSGAQSQNTMTVPASTLMNGSVVVNVQVRTTTAGNPAEVFAAATCTVTGPVFVAAHRLTVIGSPVSGWLTVDNPLDCLTGRDIETDTEALARRQANLTENANGPVQAIAEKVSLVPGVAQARGFQNVSNAAEQIVTFTGIGTGGNFRLTFGGVGGFPVTTNPIAWNAQAVTQFITFNAVPTGGSFTITVGASPPTAAIPYTATAQTVQDAIRALTGYEAATVTGSFSIGFAILLGFGPQPSISAANSLTPGITLSLLNSVQSKINDLAGYGEVKVAGSFASGFEIAFNGSVGGQPQILIVPANSITGVTAINVAFGRPGHSFEIVVDDNNGEASNLTIAETIFGAAPAGIQSFGNVSVPITDSFANVFDIEFSRPAQVPIYIVLNLATDLTTSIQPKFSPNSIPTIQAELVTIGRQFQIGGLIVGFGSGGLVGAFNGVPGISSYTMSFGTTPSPTSNSNIQLQPTQVGLFETFNIIVSYN